MIDELVGLYSSRLHLDFQPHGAWEDTSMGVVSAVASGAHGATPSDSDGAGPDSG